MAVTGTGEEPTNAELLARCRAKDETAWNALVGRHAQKMWAVIRLHGLRDADADDVFQLTATRLLTHLDTIREPDKLGAWLATTARNECLRLLGRGRRQIPSGGGEEFELVDEAIAAPDSNLIRSDEVREVWDAVAKLPAHCQRLLRFLMLEDEPSYLEISAGLAMPMGSIGPTKRRCLDHLRGLLGGIN